MLKKLFILLLLAHSAAAQIDPANVTIARDEYGVPHIFAETDPEVAYPSGDHQPRVG